MIFPSQSEGRELVIPRIFRRAERIALRVRNMCFFSEPMPQYLKFFITVVRII